MCIVRLLQHKAVCMGKFGSSSLAPLQNCSQAVPVVCPRCRFFPFQLLHNNVLKPFFVWLWIRSEPLIMSPWTTWRFWMKVLSRDWVVRELSDWEWREVFQMFCRVFFMCNDGENHVIPGWGIGRSGASGDVSGNSAMCCKYEKCSLHDWRMP